MVAPVVPCAKCKAPLPYEIFNTLALAKCPSCQSQIQVEVFPALYQRLTPGRVGESILTEQETSCFYHPDKRAMVACESCGRFLCALCDVELDGKHHCALCLETGIKKGKMKKLESQSTDYHRMALSLSIIPLLVWPFTLLTAPAAIFIAIRYWNKSTSIIPRSKFQLVFAIFFSLLQMAGWGFLFYYIFTK